MAAVVRESGGRSVPASCQVAATPIPSGLHREYRLQHTLRELGVRDISDHRQGRARDSDTGSGAGGKRDRGTVRADGSLRMSGLACDSNTRSLERTLKVFVDHYNLYRPHRHLGLVPPNDPPTANAETNGHRIKVRRRDRLGGLLHEYERAT